MYSFATPPIKLKLGQQIGGGAGGDCYLIANHQDESLWWANQKHWAEIRSYLSHSFLQVHSSAAPLTSRHNMHNYVEPKLFSWAKPAYVRISLSDFTVQDHIPSITGDTLKHVLLWNKRTCCHEETKERQSPKWPGLCTSYIHLPHTHPPTHPFQVPCLNSTLCFALPPKEGTIKFGNEIKNQLHDKH